MGRPRKDPIQTDSTTSTAEDSSSKVSPRASVVPHSDGRPRLRRCRVHWMKGGSTVFPATLSNGGSALEFWEDRLEREKKIAKTRKIKSVEAL